MADCCNVFIFKASMLEMEILNIGQHCIMTADRGNGTTVRRLVPDSSQHFRDLTLCCNALHLRTFANWQDGDGGVEIYEW